MSEGRTSSDESNQGVCKVCDGSDNSRMVQCDKCDDWFHFDCVGVSQAVENQDWLCSDCYGKQHAKNKKSTKPTPPTVPPCLSQKCYNILLDLNITSDGHLVVLHRTTLEKASINEPIHKLKLSALDHLNISEHHPLGQHFQSETVITFEKLLKLLETNELTVFLLASHTSAKLTELLRDAIARNSIFTKRIVFCCSSPVAIYQLRQHCPDLVCGLWMDKSTLSRTQQYLSASTILMSIYGAIYRNIVAPVIGISLVFIHKEEFNAQISTLWHNVGVRPIVYTINSPNEKRYFQQVTKTQYLTDSLRSEPQVIFRIKRK
ncbi:glycerophosphodiester phosphodiesterase 1 isoform X2 [Topomyia yanbarensis]|uniref:glycerophosphodiester phosphodiesterase 1 isoform X2 n=1 Tax=Topomyia yanbarensis TaxID=2498891 RepID=UPI00273C2C99|nr:glycerophosphodiester phosphodiesterase 1 isoform X2 [Topomyia yanbarensis]